MFFFVEECTSTVEWIEQAIIKLRKMLINIMEEILLKTSGKRSIKDLKYDRRV